MAEIDVFKMKEPYDDSKVSFDFADQELHKRHREQWKQMTDEEKDIYEKVMFTITPEDSDLSIATAVPENYFRDRSVEELEEDLKKRYGLDVKLSERLRTVMQDTQDDEKYLRWRIAFAEDDE